MKRILLLIAVFISFALAKQSWELTLIMNRGEITLSESRVIEGSPKEGRRRGTMSGPASAWAWQIISKDGTVLKESRFVLPDHYCSSEDHVEIDSTTAVITIPQVEGGDRVQIVNYSQGEEFPSGVESRMRSTAPVKATFNLPGGVK